MLLPQLRVPEGSLRLSGPLEWDNIVNGDGLRVVLWTQGCTQHCLGCQNPDTWDLEGGILVSTEEIIERLSKIQDQQGITFCGGEPMLQAKELLKISRWSHKNGWDVWSFTGQIYEEIYTDENPDVKALIEDLDYLIDGPFILSKRDIVNYKYRGSSNQRLLKMNHGKIEKAF